MEELAIIDQRQVRRFSESTHDRSGQKAATNAQSERDSRAAEHGNDSNSPASTRRQSRLNFGEMDSADKARDH